MFKYLLLLATASAVPCLALDSLPDGRWTGEGQSWVQGANTREKFSVVMENQANHWEQVVTYESGRTETVRGVASFGPNGSLTNQVEGLPNADTGICGTIWCHIKNEADNRFDSTFIYQGDDYFELTSRVVDGKVMIWENHLKKTQP